MIPAWLAIALVAVLTTTALSSLTPKRGAGWFRRLRRPEWLTFEGLIPLIWITIFICGGWSAYIIWNYAPENQTTWWMMGVYFLLELVTLTYTPVMLTLRRLRVGVVIGATGFAVALALAIWIAPRSIPALLLLLPYLLWSPVGTYVTWVMMGLNPADA
ncbi:MAG: tryptophan-rich sensory protein [Cyanobacteria bacterium J06639_14]